MGKIQLRLLREDLPSFNFNSDFWFKPITLSNIEEVKDDIDKVEQYHYQDIEWDSIPNYNIVKKRLTNGSVCHLFYYRDLCLGWHWTSTVITFDWITPVQQLNSKEIYGGGAFISRKYKPSASTSLYFWRQGLEYDLDYHNADIMYLYTDDWNRASTQLCYKNGFKDYNFLKR